MSNYSTITSLSESPQKAGLIYAGTDDGIIQVTEDGGENWRKIDFAKMKGLPSTAFVNDIKADLYDENGVYAVFDNHKYGDYEPYLYQSSDKGKTWTKISSNLPERTLLWRIVQDHEEKDLLFLGTEFGVYFTQDGGANWNKLNGGMPNISVRDLAIQKRENDLVLGTFGRGIYILDDYSALRSFKAEEEVQLFTPRTGKWYMQRSVLGGGKKASQGDGYFVAKNPAYGVQFSYYLKENFTTQEADRKEKEKAATKTGETVAVPEWGVLENEKKEIAPAVSLFIYDTEGKIIRKVPAQNAKGFNRVSWNYKTESILTVSPKNKKSKQKGYTVGPGTYSAQLFKKVDGSYESIGQKVSFNVAPINQRAMPGASNDEVVAHWVKVNSLWSEIRDFDADFKDAKNKMEVMLVAYDKASSTDADLQKQLLEVRSQILELEHEFKGSKARSEVGEKNEYPTIYDYLWNATNDRSTYGPTQTQKMCFENAQSLHEMYTKKLKDITATMDDLEGKLVQVGAPKIRK